jgi:hypothetical protein
MAINWGDSETTLRNAFNDGKLTLYLGAGVSIASGLPSWEELVLAMYFRTLDEEDYIRELHPYPNYLYAIAEWVLRSKKEPLEITMRKVKQWYEDKDFVRMLRETLYADLNGREEYESVFEQPESLLRMNLTLKAIIELMNRSVAGQQGISSVITYNYDNLLEFALINSTNANFDEKFQTIFRGSQRINRGEKIPIYHVHGYLPHETDENILESDIIFSEDQYNRVFQDDRYWGNVVQMNQLTNDIGLMIGLSLSDRNTRRILDSILNQPIRSDNFILIQNPKSRNGEFTNQAIEEIDNLARKSLDKFNKAGIKKGGKAFSEIRSIMNKVYEYDRLEFHKGFESLGLSVITYDDHEEIPDVLNRIIS